jgi:magnesium-transporting ATPase (P-type)
MFRGGWRNSADRAHQPIQRPENPPVSHPIAAQLVASVLPYAFSVLVFGELFRAFAARSTTRVFWEVGAFTNLRLFGVVVVSVLIQLGIHHIPAAQAVFEIGPLSAADCFLTLLVGLGPVTLIEVAKLVRRWNAHMTAL